ncbi:DUF2214 family protein [Emcibacter sp.]|uniref:DUF2214 family protein n=1 Tax=Emcibacter sp. TaxID=1979954 RepID=UPI002AA88187|nr:DUF2214 family protein [Emcibacter sp.]
MEDVFIRYFHFLGIIGVGATLTAEHLLLKSEMTVTEMRRIAVIDALYGLSAGIVLLAGLALWFVVGNADYYLGNWIFHLKLGVFVLIGVLSLWPTFFFLKSRKMTGDTIQVPRKMIMAIRLELLLYFLLPLLAVLMARGYGVMG